MMILLPASETALRVYSLASLDDDELNKLYDLSRKCYSSLVKLQFQLVYHANFSIQDLDLMTRYEYTAFFTELKTQRELEKKAHEESLAKAKSKGARRRR